MANSIVNRALPVEQNFAGRYETPAITYHGKATRLTTGGSGNASEGEAGNARPRP